MGTGALPVLPPIEKLAGADALGPEDGVHLLYSMGDTFALMQTLEQDGVERAVIVGAGYIGLEMAEAITARGLHVTQLEQLPEVLPTVDPEQRLCAQCRSVTTKFAWPTSSSCMANSGHGGGGCLGVGAGQYGPRCRKTVSV